MKNFIFLTFLICVFSFSRATLVQQTQIDALTTALQETTNQIKALQNDVSFLRSQLPNNKQWIADTVNGGRINLYNYIYRTAKIYHDVSVLVSSNIIRRRNENANDGWDSKSHIVNEWNGRKGIKLGQGVSGPNDGLLINAPNDGSNVLWVRVFNDRWSTFRVAPLPEGDEPINYEDWIDIYACGWRQIIETAPDGAASDSYWHEHQWCPIPIRFKSRKWVLYNEKNSDNWISGLAFGKNLWNHAKNSAVAYHWKLNGGTDIEWDTHTWNNDVLARIPQKKISELQVPVIYTGKDKIIYFAEHNNNWNGVMHGDVWINGVKVERFRTSYSNPFATHINSKMYARYVATRIPAGLIRSDDEFVTLRIDMLKQNHNIYFRELGTHDYF